MAKYLARQIKAGKLNYDEVIEKYPQYKEEIDEILGKREPQGSFLTVSIPE